MAGIPLIGDKFPEMKVQTTHGMMNLPEKFKGQWFILFSHPADFTPVCTTEFYAFQQRYAKFKELGAELVGLSVDQVFSHIKWVEWIEENLAEKIEFPIIADTGAVAEMLGLIHPGSGTHTVRAVFFVDPQSTIRAILYYPAELGRNMDEFLRMLKGFQIADEYKVAIPANWPENELFGDDVIVPPASNLRDAEARKGQEGCLDWWLCHKKIA
ncbi:MAG TPA: peroxiredoxin [Thermoflexia bacterium]|nr:peroxiredoxin [Thermoflexia bacterium]